MHLQAKKSSPNLGRGLKNLSFLGYAKARNEKLTPNE
jgi:hypothetical protein